MFFFVTFVLRGINTFKNCCFTIKNTKSTEMKHKMIGHCFYKSSDLTQIISESLMI
jgi:hypothetical protein